MRNRFLVGAGAALAMALSSADASAQWLPWNQPGVAGSWYFGGEGGWTMLDNGTGNAGGIGSTQHFKDGFNIGARAGYEWGPWRLEEEFSYRQNGIGSVAVLGANFNTHGDRNTYAFMTNLLYDFTFGWPVTPHIGGGIGAVNLHDSWGIAGIGNLANSSTWVFGYQGIAGIRYNINPALAFDLDYRYLGTTDPTFGTRFANVKINSGYSSNSVLASLTVRFGAPPPPPPPPLPPAPPPIARKVFLVFFDWDKSTITSEGMAIIQQAAAAFRAGGPVTIQVTGYADRSGSPGYNQRLSERRANNVANALTQAGVPRQQMAVSGRGENDNRVPTADGVREPQNRRVEIVF